MGNGLLRAVAGALAALAILAWCAAYPAQAERRVALVVGNSSYLHSAALRNPRNDAEDVADKLRELEFQVIEAYDLSRSGFTNSLQSFATLLDGADVGLFYYAGHGLQYEGRNFLVATDARLDNEFSIDAETVSLDTIIRLMESRAPVNFVFLDACRNNPLAEGLRRNLAGSTRSAVVGRGLARVEASDNDTLIVFAAGAGQEAEDGSGRNSPFTQAVLKHIGTPGLEVSVAMKLVTREVRLATSGRQRPEQLTSMGQLFFFRPDQVGSDVAQPSSQGDEAIAALPPVRPTPDQPPPQALAACPVRIGTVGPMSGIYSSFGEQLRVGTTQAVEDINSAGGLLGCQVELLIEDDACDPRTAVTAANNLVAKGVIFVAGHFCSGSSIPASKVYAQEDVLQISPASSNPMFTDQGGWNTHRVVPRDDAQGAFAGAYLAGKFRRVAILHDQTAYGRGLAEKAKSALELNGRPETLYEAYRPGEADYLSLVSKLKRANIEAVYIGGYHTEAGLILKQMREQGLKAKLISGDALLTDEFWAITGDAGEGTLISFLPDPRRFRAASEVVERLRSENKTTEGYTLYAYAAVQAWAEAARAVASVHAGEIASKLRSGSKFRTVLGEIGFNAKGDVVGLNHVWYVWSNGTYVESVNP